MSESEPRREAERLAAVVAATRDFARAVPNYEELLRTIAQSVAEATGDGCTIRLLSDDGAQLVAVGGYHPDAEFRAALEAVVGETTARQDIGIWRRVIEDQQQVHVAVTAEAALPADSAARHVAFAKRWPIRDIVLAPLIARGRALGGIALVRYRDPTPFTQEEQDFLQDLADRAALAVDNSRLIRDAQRLNVELEATVARRTLELREANQGLAALNAGLVALGQLGNALAAAEDVDEAYATIGHSASGLYGGLSGAVYERGPSGAGLEVAIRWGDLPIAEGFSPAECLAVRERRLRAGSESAQCAHVAIDAARRSLCVPMLSGRHVFGVLHLTGVATSGIEPISSIVEELGIASAEQSAFALMNIRLREKLTVSSLRDPLTGMYNRRHADEALARELTTATLERTQLTILMLDLDHFKRINDEFGHDAGDAVLRTVGTVLQEEIRSSDVACRLGGEEFLVILPRASLDVARRKSDALHAALRSIELSHGGRRLPPVTFSAGAAVFPEDGATADALLRSADAALYQAKKAGRDRTASASSDRAALRSRA